MHTSSKTPQKLRSRGEQGLSLVYVIATMVIFGFLGMVMISIFSSTITSTAKANLSQQALYLAESGIRYV
ncbi:MAG: type IV pilus modification PilV family protein, partial [Desulfovibrionales bacterium]